VLTNQLNSMAKKFRILSLDGGGLRGIIPVLILKEIEKRSGQKIFNLFDLISGTSTGGLIACGITVSDDGIHPKYSIQQIEDIYTNRGKDIFPKQSALGRLLNSISSLKNPKFSEKGIDNVLTDYFGNKRLTDCIKPLLITSFDLYNNEAVFFKSRHAQQRAECNAYLKDVCRATSAAPTYLPAYKFMFDNKTRVCVDGGMYINNPTVASLVEVTKYYNDPAYQFESVSLDDIVVPSLGTGHYSNDIARKKVEGFGLLDWATNIADVMMQAVNQTTTYQADELTANENFLRINVDITDEKFSDMANSSDDTRNYLINTVQSQLFGNKTLMTQLDTIIAKLQVKEGTMIEL
jgi:uncharacterized protein